MAALAPTLMICFAALIATTAARPGPQMTFKSGTLRIWSAAARLRTSERLCSLRLAILLTPACAAPTAENATCLGRRMTPCQLETADAGAPGEAYLVTIART